MVNDIRVQQGQYVTWGEFGPIRDEVRDIRTTVVTLRRFVGWMLATGVAAVTAVAGLIVALNTGGHH